jgi:hypothetical protein
MLSPLDMRRHGGSIGLLLLLSANAVRADGGAVEGRVVYVGSRAAAPPTPVPKAMAACGKSKPQVALLVGEDRGLANVLVSIPASGPKPPVKEARVEQRGCEYLPHAQVVIVGTPLTVTNDDPLLHNVHARRGDITLANLAMPIKGQSMKAPPQLTSRPGLVTLKCDAGHTWMSAVVAVVDTPFAAVTDAHGVFRIEGLPPGSYTIKLEHELLGSATQNVTVTAGGVAHVDVELK